MEQTDLFVGEEGGVGAYEKREARRRKPPKPDAAPAARKLEARAYQKDAVERVFDAWHDSRTTLVVMATGLGKTVVAGHVVRRWRQSCVPWGLPFGTLFLAHRETLVLQAAETIRAINPGLRVEVEMARDRADAASADVVVASVQSLSQPGRLAHYSPDRFGQITIDEAHHYVRDNKQYQAIVDHFDHARVLGITATPDRTDEVPLGLTFESVALAYDVFEGVTDGWLVPILQQFVLVTGYDLSRLPKTAKDFTEAQLTSALDDEKPLQGICHAATDAATADPARPRQTIVFAPSVGIARKMADILNRRHAACGTGPAASIDCIESKNWERRAVIQRYRRGEIRYIVNYGILTEGFDAPETSLVVIARPTKSRALYAQMVGRGTRPDPAVLAALATAPGAEARRAAIAMSGKREVLVLDPVGATGSHKLITAVDILGGNFAAGVVESARKPPGRGDAPLDVVAELIRARKEAEEAERKKREKIVIDAEYTVRTVNPFDALDCHTAAEPAWMKGRPATDPQKRLLRRHGVPEKDMAGMSMFRANKLMDTILERRRKGLCTLAQARQLEKYGVDPDTKAKDADRILLSLAADGWRRPAGGSES